jgi:hypothetical protein
MMGEPPAPAHPARRRGSESITRKGGADPARTPGPAAKLGRVAFPINYAQGKGPPSMVRPGQVGRGVSGRHLRR